MGPHPEAPGLGELNDADADFKLVDDGLPQDWNPGGPPAWDLSCPDWRVLLRERRSLIPDLPLDRARADQALAVFKRLRIPNVPGQPTYGEAAGPETLRFVEAIFGGYDTATQQRMIRGYTKLVPKKNGKTTDGGAISLTAAILNDRPQAELIFTAASHTISRRGYNHAKGMIALDREGYLQQRFHVRDHEQTIVDRVTGSELKVHTFGADIVTGAVPVFVLVDELHLLGRMANAGPIMQQLTGGMVSVPDACWVKISTQSTAPPAGVFKADLALARKIRDGEVRDVDILPVLYELPEELQKDRAYWENPRNWAQLQPNLGRSVFIPRLVKDLAEESRKGEEAVRVWFSQHLNIEMGLALHTDRWQGTDYWEARTLPGLTLDELLRRCEVVVPGIDGGGLDDLFGLTLAGRCRETRRTLTWSRGWLHHKVFNLRKSEVPKLLDFEQQGDLFVVDKMEEAFAQAAALAAGIKARNLLHVVCLDPAGSARIVQALEAAGIPPELHLGVKQGWPLSGAIKDTETELADGVLWHADQPLMAWCVSNAKAEARGNATVIQKQTSGTGKIDLLIALFIAMSQLRTNPKPRSNLAQLIAEDRAIL